MDGAMLERAFEMVSFQHNAKPEEAWKAVAYWAAGVTPPEPAPGEEETTLQIDVALLRARHWKLPPPLGPEDHSAGLPPR